MAFRNQSSAGFSAGVLPPVARDNLALTAAVAFAVVCGLLALVFNAMGYPIVAGMTVVFGIVIAVSTIVFVTIPIMLMKRFTS